MPYGSSYQQRLVEAILRIPGAGNRDVRDRYISTLTVLLDAPVDFMRSDSPTEDFTRLVAWCESQSRGLPALVDAIDLVEGASIAVDRLRAIVTIRQPAEVLRPHERAKLIEVLDRLGPPGVASLMRDLTPRWGPRLRGEANDPQSVLSLLEDSIAGTGEPHPLFVFLSRLLERHGDSTTEDLGELVNDVGARTGVPPGALADRPVQAPDPGWHYFVVRLAEDGIRASRYLLTVWLVAEDGTWDPRYTSNTSHDLDEIHDMIDHQLTLLAGDEAVDIGALWIEFILPRPLLGHAVDQWVVAAPGVSSPIGVHYPVVVRDLVRMRNRIIRHRWQRRCRWLHNHGDTAAMGAVRFEHLQPDHPDRFAELMQDQERPTCMVVLGPSAAHVAGKIGAWLSAGIPVIVWCREARLSSSFDAHLASVLISGGGVKSLPTAVWRLRQDAGVPDNAHEHVGGHITLLWDDERRLPPDERPLGQPAAQSS